MDSKTRLDEQQRVNLRLLKGRLINWSVTHVLFGLFETFFLIMTLSTASKKEMPAVVVLYLSLHLILFIINGAGAADSEERNPKAVKDTVYRRMRDILFSVAGEIILDTIATVYLCFEGAGDYPAAYFMIVLAVYGIHLVHRMLLLRKLKFSYYWTRRNIIQTAKVLTAGKFMLLHDTIGNGRNFLDYSKTTGYLLAEEEQLREIGIKPAYVRQNCMTEVFLVHGEEQIAAWAEKLKESSETFLKRYVFLDVNRATNEADIRKKYGYYESLYYRKLIDVDAVDADMIADMVKNESLTDDTEYQDYLMKRRQNRKSAFRTLILTLFLLLLHVTGDKNSIGYHRGVGLSSTYAYLSSFVLGAFFYGIGFLMECSRSEKKFPKALKWKRFGLLAAVVWLGVQMPLVASVYENEGVIVWGIFQIWLMVRLYKMSRRLQISRKSDSFAYEQIRDNNTARIVADTLDKPRQLLTIAYFGYMIAVAVGTVAALLYVSAVRAFYGKQLDNFYSLFVAGIVVCILFQIGGIVFRKVSKFKAAGIFNRIGFFAAAALFIMQMKVNDSQYAIRYSVIARVEDVYLAVTAAYILMGFLYQSGEKRRRKKEKREQKQEQIVEKISDVIIQTSTADVDIRRALQIAYDDPVGYCDLIKRYSHIALPNQYEYAKLRIFFQNALLFRNISRSTMALLDYIEMILRLVHYYVLLDQFGELPELNAETIPVSLNVMAANIYLNSKELDLNDKIKLNSLERCILDNLGEKTDLVLEGSRMDFTGFVNLVKIIRDKVVAHGVLREKNVMEIWSFFVYAAILLTRYLKMSDFLVEQDADAIRIGYKGTGKTHDAGRLLIFREDELYIAGMVSRDVTPKITYVNYFSGDLIIPSYLED